jgi:hypothetical protein
MKGEVCIGGISVEGHENMRLLPRSGSHSHPVSALYRIGQLWEMDLKAPVKTVRPHVEDQLVQEASPAGEVDDVAGWLGRHASVISGDSSALFDGRLHSSKAGTVYIDENGIPPMSVGFWRPRTDLHVDDEGQRYRTTFGLRDVAIKYVGEAPITPVIPAGSLVRVSLARWFSPSGSGWEACWLQVSGWYPAPSS